MPKFILVLLTLTLASSQAFSSTAGCRGEYKGKKLSFLAKGSLNATESGTGYVKIDGKEVARFDGDAANISYLARKFSIENSRGDYVEGKLHNIMNGRSTLRRLVLPGEGVDVSDIPVTCWFRR